VQGITGREGRARTRLMREYGTNVGGGAVEIVSTDARLRAGAKIFNLRVLPADLTLIPMRHPAQIMKHGELHAWQS